MKPSEMSNEELAEAMMDMPYINKECSAITLECCARLRNSIPQPVVEVHVVDDASAWGCSVFVNEHEYGNNLTSSEAHELSNRLRTALGINDTEGVSRGCDKACSPSDWCSGGYCDRMGCYTEGGE